MHQLKQCKESMNDQEDQILQLELKLERAALDHKIAMQDKDDIISEEKLNLRHKDSELREVRSTLERVRDDIGFKI